MALNAHEGSCGPVTDITVRGIYTEGSYSAVRLLCSCPKSDMKNIHISDIYGVIDFESDSILKNVTIRNVHRKEYVDATPTITMGENIDVKNLTLENITTENYTEAKEMPFMENRSPVNDIHTKGLYADGKKVNI